MPREWSLEAYAALKARAFEAHMEMMEAIERAHHIRRTLLDGTKNPDEHEES